MNFSIFNLLNSVFVFIGISLISIIVINLIKDLRKFRIRSKRLEDWSKFSKRILDFADEIQDSQIKEEYIHFCIDKVFTQGVNKVEQIASGEFSPENLLEKIHNKYSNQIPSLKREFRENRINKILG